MKFLSFFFCILISTLTFAQDIEVECEKKNSNYHLKAIIKNIKSEGITNKQADINLAYHQSGYAWNFPVEIVPFPSSSGNGLRYAGEEMNLDINLGQDEIPKRNKSYKAKLYSNSGDFVLEATVSCQFHI